MIHPLAQESFPPSTTNTSAHHDNTDAPIPHAMTVDHASITPQHPLLQDDIGQEQHQQQQRQRPQSTLTESTTTQANYYNSSQYYASPPPPSPGFAPYSPRHQQQQQRAYSVTAMPSELQHAVLRHQQQLAEQQQQLLAQAAEQPWWQYYYQLYHYHPPPGRKPTVFGPYLLLQTLGEGEFGKVKLGIHIETGHEVCLCFVCVYCISYTQMTHMALLC